MTKIGNKGFSSPKDILVTKAMIQNITKVNKRKLKKNVQRQDAGRFSPPNTTIGRWIN